MIARRAALCVLLFHAPDGSELRVQSEAISAVRAVEPGHKVHIAPGTHAVIYLGVRTHGFGIKETPAQVQEQIENCRRCPDNCPAR